MNQVLAILIGTLLLACLFNTFFGNLYEGYAGYGPEYSTNNPEGAPWDISSPFYGAFWGYDRPYSSYYNNYLW